MKKKQKSGLPTCVEMENRTHQSEKEVKIGIGPCDEDDDVHNLCGRRIIHVSDRIFGFQATRFAADAICTHTNDRSNRASLDDCNDQTLDNVVDGR